QAQRGDDPLDDPPDPVLVEADLGRLEPPGPLDEGPPAPVEEDLRHLRVAEEGVEAPSGGPAPIGTAAAGSIMDGPAHAAHRPPTNSGNRSSSAPAGPARAAGRRLPRTPASTARAISARQGTRPTTGTPRTAATSSASSARPGSSTRNPAG